MPAKLSTNYFVLIYTGCIIQTDLEKSVSICVAHAFYGCVNFIHCLGVWSKPFPFYKTVCIF